MLSSASYSDTERCIDTRVWKVEPAVFKKLHNPFRTHLDSFFSESHFDVILVLQQNCVLYREKCLPRKLKYNRTEEINNSLTEGCDTDGKCRAYVSEISYSTYVHKCGKILLVDLK